MHYYQGYDDILNGSFVELAEDKRHEAPPELRAELFKRAQGMLPGRLHFDDQHLTRSGGHGYLDVVPYYVQNETSMVEIREEPVTKVDYHSMFPLKRCDVVNF